MSGMPKQGTQFEIAVSAYTNVELGRIVNRAAEAPKNYSMTERRTYFKEAARRLMWPDAYASHGRQVSAKEVLDMICDGTSVDEQAEAIAEWINGGCRT